MQYALGYAWKLNELFMNFKSNALKIDGESLRRLYGNEHKKLLCYRVFRECVKLVVDDIIDNDVEFRLPTGSRKTSLLMHTYRDEDFKRARQNGKFSEVDFLDSAFTGNQIILYMYGHRNMPKTKQVYVNKELKQRITDYTHQKRVYVYNPWIYSKNNKIHLDILNMFKDSKWRSIIDLQLSERDTFDYVMWMHNVKQRDNNKCIICGDDLDIEVHHISPFSEDYENRTNVDNGVCLCKRHHSSKIIGGFHQTYGTRNNTHEQLQTYIDNKRNELNLPSITIEEIINK